MAASSFAGITEHDRRFEGIEEKLTEHDEKFLRLEIKLETEVEKSVRVLYDAFDRTQDQNKEVQNRLNSLEKRVTKLEIAG